MVPTVSNGRPGLGAAAGQGGESMRRIRKTGSVRLFVLMGELLLGILATTVLVRTVFHQSAQPAALLLATPGSEQGEAADLGRLDTFWSDRFTYPTGDYNGLWLRRAAAQDARVPRGVPGPNESGGGGSGASLRLRQARSPFHPHAIRAR